MEVNNPLPLSGWGQRWAGPQAGRAAVRRPVKGYSRGEIGQIDGSCWSPHSQLILLPGVTNTLPLHRGGEETCFDRVFEAIIVGSVP